ncbi:general stress protein CsbD [Mycobacterium alsense]|uniref:General stress protein CsbD n=1 Tax=Mycobacterium alsense TaxID=324058 RepID=A0ABD6NZV5_9MYCO|nr:general stress protein CsbD [Mycobacterium alsense]OBG37396.1 general stress protein CsbD [Mycobacterium alsense]OBJ01531.1 general stress protein CsbD [Mycobacterium alsense]
MVDNKSGPVELVRGIVEGVLGKAKQFLGTVLGRNDLINEGEAQQDKADAQRDAGRKEAEAEKARGKAKAYEERERAEQQ